MGLDVEPAVITDLRARTAMAYIIGRARGSDGVEYGLEVDSWVSEGAYRAADGSTNRGAFAMLWIDLFEPGSGSQVHDYNGGIQPNGLFWSVAVPPGSFSLSVHQGRARFRWRTFQSSNPSCLAGRTSFRPSSA